MKQENFSGSKIPEQMSLFQEELISSSEGPRARDSASRESRMDLMTREAPSASPIANFLRLCVPGGSCGKTSPVFSVQIKGMTSGRSCEKLMKSGILSHGECWTLNTCEWTDTLAPFLKEDGVSSLSDILETGDIPPRYYLSPAACRGILRRAEARGRALPEVLRQVLEAQAGKSSSVPSSAETEDC